jgi:hypothetical protein
VCLPHCERQRLYLIMPSGLDRCHFFISSFFKANQICCRDSLLVDCVYINGTSQCRGANSKLWKECSGVAYEPVPIDKAVSTDSANLPTAGQLCRTYPQPQVNCSAGLLCVSLPENAIVADILVKHDSALLVLPSLRMKMWFLPLPT